MPVRIKSKNSVVKDKAPLPADLEIGELALNAHQDSPAVYLKDAAGAVRKIAGVGSVSTPDATATSKGVVQLADAAAVTAGTAGRVVDAAQLKAAVAAEDLWDRTGTEISPKTAGDSVFTRGDVKVGGLTAAPAAKMAANGDITGQAINVVGDTHTTHSTVRDLKGATTTRYGFQLANSQADQRGTLDLFSVAAAGTALTALSVRKGGETKLRIGVDGTTQWGTGPDTGVISTTRAAVDPNTGNATFLGEIKIGGAAGASNITLSAAGNIRALGAVSRIHADNTAAKAAGLVSGDIYRKADGTLMIVH